MDWELKKDLVRLGNCNRVSDESKNEFQSFVLNNIDKFDLQSWDMFVMVADLIVDEMKTDIKFWKEVFKRAHKLDCNDERFGFRSGMRIALLQTICEDELKLTAD